jgi:hypothetical protein
MRIFIFLAAVIALVSISSCGGGGGNSVIPPPPDKAIEWTVMLYMGGDNNLAPCALADLDELEQVGSTDKVHFTALADVYAEYESQFGTYAIGLADSDGKLVTPMMHITKHPEEDVQSHLADPEAVLYPNDGFNSADPTKLTNFIKWSKQRFPAKHCALIIWDHGSSWLPGRVSSAAVYDEYEGNGNAMFIHEIKSAIAASGVHLDLLDFTACNMASVEAAYQLKDVTNYICASQKVMWLGADGCFEDFANFLITNPSTDARSLGKRMVDAYVDAYAENGGYTVTKSLIQTSKLGPIAGAVSQLTPLLADSKVISPGKLQSTFYEPIRFLQDVDICNFTNVLPFHVSNTALNNALANVRQKVKEAVVYNRVFVTSSEIPSWKFGSREFGQGEDINVNGVGGLNIFLPTEKDWTQANFGYYTSMDFVKASGWNWVIAHAYQGIPYLGTAPGNWLSMLVWSTNVDLDFWIFEPDGYGRYIPASPCLGPNSPYGYLSADSFWTGIPVEAYQTKQRILVGPYFFLAVYSGPSIFANDAWCALGIFDNPAAEEPAIVSNDYYISATQPVDPDFGAGVVFFGFAFYDPPTETWWFYENDRTGESVTQDQIGSIAGQLQQLGPQTADSKLRRPQGIDQATLDRWSAQGAALAQRLRDSGGNPNENALANSGWAKAE